MEFDCKSQHHKCKAKCCGIIDFQTEFWEKNQHNVITQPIEVIPFPNGENVIPITESGYCAFLREDYQCNIYQDRPEVCREYGSESTPYMSCPYLKKDGTERSRQQRRCIERMVNKGLDSLQHKLVNLKRKPKE